MYVQPNIKCVLHNFWQKVVHLGHVSGQIHQWLILKNTVHRNLAHAQCLYLSGHIPCHQLSLGQKHRAVLGEAHTKTGCRFSEDEIGADLLTIISRRHIMLYKVDKPLKFMTWGLPCSPKRIGHLFS